MFQWPSCSAPRHSVVFASLLLDGTTAACSHRVMSHYTVEVMELLRAAAPWSKRWCSAEERLRTLQDPSCLSPQTDKRLNQSACTGGRGGLRLETVHTEDVQRLLLLFFLN